MKKIGTKRKRNQVFGSIWLLFVIWEWIKCDILLQFYFRFKKILLIWREKYRLFDIFIIFFSHHKNIEYWFLFDVSLVEILMCKNDTVLWNFGNQIFRD